ncbi:hypothetical protein, partial [Escherichia coli]|uniref:hypothetical protein n=1 Tax=Escherichia coli TaxID=562 RepID=UPI001365B765
MRSSARKTNADSLPMMIAAFRGSMLGISSLTHHVGLLAKFDATSTSCGSTSVKRRSPFIIRRASSMMVE